MGIVLDGSVLIDCERHRIDVAQKVAGREDEEFFLSVVSVSELLHGVYRASNESIRARRSAFVEAVLATFPLLEIDVTVAREMPGFGSTWRGRV